MSRWGFLFVAATCGVLSAQAAEPESVAPYKETARKIIEAAMADQHSLDRLEYLCDSIGNRLSGSPALMRAISWAAGAMKEAGLENVRTPKVMVNHWVRGAESATMLTPV